MQLTITIPDNFYMLSLQEQTILIRRVLEQQRSTRRNFLQTLQQMPDVLSDLTEEKQLTLIDHIREEIYQNSQSV
jgi:hypothetical protein